MQKSPSGQAWSRRQAPRSIEQVHRGENGDNLGLPSSGTDGDVVGTSPTTATDGLSLVPYTNVFAQYQQFYYQAIENGQVPIQFYDLIRNYFISLK